MVRHKRRDLLLVANNLSDTALLLDPADGKVLKRFFLNTENFVKGCQEIGFGLLRSKISHGSIAVIKHFRVNTG